MSSSEKEYSDPFGLVACVLLFLSVALGAFAAHGLEGRIEERSMEIFQTAVRYQTMHGLAMLVFFALGIARTGFRSKAINLQLLIGVIIFSGSLYALALMPQYGFLGLTTPIGGLFFLAGWAIATNEMYAWIHQGKLFGSGINNSTPLSLKELPKYKFSLLPFFCRTERFIVFQQLRTRNEKALDEWGKTGLPKEKVQKVLELLKWELEWPNHYFIPDDELSLIWTVQSIFIQDDEVAGFIINVEDMYPPESEIDYENIETLGEYLKLLIR